jgi:K(+)-stimulated pyrophosphate-energized sodium pump
MITFFSLIVTLTGIAGLFLSYLTYQSIIIRSEGTQNIKVITAQIREGARSFLAQESRYLSFYMAVVFIILVFLLNVETASCFLLGVICSLSASFIGMTAATYSNGRAAFAASENNPDDALIIAVDGGKVMGLAVASIGLLGMGLIMFFCIVENLEQPLVGFGVGATSVALFARIGGGIYTKAADVGADLVGKVEAGIPEDDPRNPGVIADNVGDNVGDVAGMGADIFESYVNSIIGCTAIGATAHFASLNLLSSYDKLSIKSSINYLHSILALTPFLLAILGLIGSLIGLKYVKQNPKGDPTAILQRGTALASLFFLGLALIFFLFVPGLKTSLWWCVVVGTTSGLIIGLMAEYYTASKPIFEIAEASKTGPATNIISGLSIGFRSVVAPLWVIAGAVLIGFSMGGVYGIALTAVGMLSITCMVMTIDAFGPIADNAGGISEMAGLGEETRAITDKLDASGNTTAAIGKGFAVCSATLTAISLFGAYTQTINVKAKSLGLGLPDWSITNPDLTVGTLIGASLTAMIACLTMTAVGKAAGKMVDEIRRQFREIPGLLEGKEGAKPDVARCVKISTDAALSQMALPGIVAIGIPVLVGYALGAVALAGVLLGTLITGLLLALFMANAGGAWDNAKKFIEQGKIPGEKKGSDAHKAAVVGDTVGDPFKDTSGPSLNILIKLVSMVALLIAPTLY